LALTAFSNASRSLPAYERMFASILAAMQRSLGAVGKLPGSCPW
jgi:hypothetical protein